jgi:anthranilate phosphoribosyltransferase
VDAVIQQALTKLIDGKDLSSAEAEKVMHEIMRGEATAAQIGGFLTALRIKGETVEEIAGCAVAMRSHAKTVKPHRATLIDVCGTGGDGKSTFNISSTVSFVIAGAGMAVAKHGNRSISSRSGSADLLQALGVNIDLNTDQVAQCVDEIGIGFLFAPALHPALRYATGPRRELGVRTIFNLLGPLCNPARASVQLIGVYSEELVEPLAKVLRNLGSQRAIVVHGADGLDELSTTGVNHVAELRDGIVSLAKVHPLEAGLPLAKLKDLIGGTPEENAAMTKAILQGERGARRDVVLLNAAAALIVGGLATDLRQGVEIAATSIDSGKAMTKLKQLTELSQALSRESQA